MLSPKITAENCSVRMCMKKKDEPKRGEGQVIKQEIQIMLGGSMVQKWLTLQRAAEPMFVLHDLQPTKNINSQSKAPQNKVIQ